MRFLAMVVLVGCAGVAEAPSGDCMTQFSEDDGFDSRIRPFRREELLQPLERLFFGHAP